MKYTITDEEAANLVREIASLQTEVKMLREMNEQLKSINPLSYYQLCPKCHGQGAVSKPPYVAGDVSSWVQSAATFQCDVCNGMKVLFVSIQNTDDLPHTQSI
jgi:hypothetical protein